MAEAKARFSELLSRVARGERFVIARRGRPIAALCPPESVTIAPDQPHGLASVAGALGDWDGLAAVVDEVYAARRRARDREAPDLS